MKHRCAVGFIASLMLAVTARAQFVEVEATIDVTNWTYNEETGLPLKSTRDFSVRCVAGANTWLIESHSSTNLKQTIWFVKDKLVRQFAAGDRDAALDESDPYPVRRGPRTASIGTSEDGYPAGDIYLNLPWFAFCSGSYFKRPNRSVPLPAPVERSAFGFKDETTVFDDALGLPRRVDLFTWKHQNKCEYRVEQSTNVLGWNFPTVFTVVQNAPDEFDQWRRQLTATGRVTRIRPAARPALPAEIQTRLDYLERFPGRRR